jgi:aspartate/methionine/tyrosine aminotransferase
MNIASRRAIGVEASRIREVADAAMTRQGMDRAAMDRQDGGPDVLAFWFGESDLPTPQVIREAGARALAEGRTFYTQNLGLPALRQAIATYVGDLHRVALAPESVAVASSGVSALMLAMQAILDPGDRVVAVTPVWPNLVQIPGVLGAKVHAEPLEVRDGVWTLNLERLLAALTADTRLLLFNSPNNPTGWRITPEQQGALLDHCRRLGIWIISDDVYERLAFDLDARAAPSLLRLTEPGDRVVTVNSFSKAWSMTGWRLGWLTAPPELMAHLPKLVEYNTSCAPEFVQIAGITALEQGEDAAREARARLEANRDLLLQALGQLPGVTTTRPEGAMYLFFRLAGVRDTMAGAFALVDAGLGLAPGVAFGWDAPGWFRWCLASDPARLRLGAARLAAFLRS